MCARESWLKSGEECPQELGMYYQTCWSSPHCKYQVWLFDLVFININVLPTPNQQARLECLPTTVTHFSKQNKLPVPIHPLWREGWRTGTGNDGFAALTHLWEALRWWTRYRSPCFLNLPLFYLKLLIFLIFYRISLSLKVVYCSNVWPSKHVFGQAGLGL